MASSRISSCSLSGIWDVLGLLVDACEVMNQFLGDGGLHLHRWSFMGLVCPNADGFVVVYGAAQEVLRRASHGRRELSRTVKGTLLHGSLYLSMVPKAFHPQPAAARTTPSPTPTPRGWAIAPCWRSAGSGIRTLPNV